MTDMRRLFVLCGLLLLSCGHNSPQGGKEEIAISRLLEKAIEIGDKYITDRYLIENIALTEGTAAAAKRSDELNHRADYDTFWANLEESDRIWREIPDTLEKERIRSRMMPYLYRLREMVDEIIPQ